MDWRLHQSCHYSIHSSHLLARYASNDLLETALMHLDAVNASDGEACPSGFQQASNLKRDARMEARIPDYAA
jgi:hypothetical protein